MINDNSELLKDKDEIFRLVTAELLCIVKRLGHGLELTVAFLCKRITNTDEEYWKKLRRLLYWV